MAPLRPSRTYLVKRNGPHIHLYPVLVMPLTLDGIPIVWDLIWFAANDE